MIDDFKLLIIGFQVAFKSVFNFWYDVYILVSNKRGIECLNLLQSYKMQDGVF